MTPSHQKLDPHLEGVLRDIEADPKARLFRVSPRQLLQGLKDRDPVVGTRQVGLSSAERELVEVHREEVARLLYDVALADLYGGGHERIAPQRWITHEREVQLATPAEVEHRTSVITTFGNEGGVYAPELALLSKCMGVAADSRPDATRLLLSSLRLSPRSRTRITLAIALLARDEVDAADGTLRAVLDRRTAPLIRAVALGNLAFVRKRQGNDGAALEFSRESRLCRGDRISQLLNEFTFALRVGDAERSIAASRRIHDLVGGDHPAVVQFARDRREKRASSGEIPTRECLQLLPRLQGKLPVAAERIIDVYH